MGHKYSTVKVTAKITLHATNNTVDSLRLSYKGSSCCGRRRVFATFTFPKGGWLQVSEDILRNSSSKGVSVPLEKLQKKDGDTSVRITCLAGGVPVYKTQLALADLLEGLRLTVRGNEALLLFNLTGGKVEGSEAHAFKTLFCNGRRCGEAPLVEAPRRPPVEGEKLGKDGKGVEDSPGPCGDGRGLEESPGLVGNGKGVEDSPGPCGDGRGLEESPEYDGNDEEMHDSPDLGQDGQGQDVGPVQKEEATVCQSAPQEGARCYNKEVPVSPYHYVATPTASGSGGQGRGGLMNTLGICAIVVVYILMCYNAWLEWNKTY